MNWKPERLKSQITGSEIIWDWNRTSDSNHTRTETTHQRLKSHKDWNHTSEGQKLHIMETKSYTTLISLNHIINMTWNQKPWWLKWYPTKTKITHHTSWNLNHHRDWNHTHRTCLSTKHQHLRCATSQEREQLWHNNSNQLQLIRIKNWGILMTMSVYNTGSHEYNKIHSI